MRIARERQFEIVGAIVGLVVSFTLAFLGISAFGARGKLGLVVAVPYGMVAGWLLARLLVFAHRFLSDTDE